eukprot:scaffold23463_cov59-Phaeocystis_antarctica.AAC.6
MSARFTRGRCRQDGTGQSVAPAATIMPLTVTAFYDDASEISSCLVRDGSHLGARQERANLDPNRLETPGSHARGR